jgi:hypothetical protein
MDPLSRLRDLAISDSGFVFDPYSGSTFSLNGSGLTFLRGIKAGLGREELKARLDEEFDLSGVDFDRDLAEFIQLLRRHDLVSADFSL